MDDHPATGLRARRSRRVAGVAAVLAAGVGGVALLMAGGGDDDSGGVVPLPAALTPDDAFTDDLDPLPAGDRADSTGGLAEVDSHELDPPVLLAAVGVWGAEPRLYAAPRDEAACDVDALSDLLVGDDEPGDPELADAWFDTQGRRIEERERDDHLESLTAVRLRSDTRVTAHDWVGGDARPYQAVLQAGTAVLVDEMGVPRVRCAGGLPLDAPEPAPADMAAEEVLDERHIGPPGDAWPGFTSAMVVVVESRPVGGDGLEVVAIAGSDDTDEGETFVRALGSDGDRDRGVFTPTEDEGCASGCHELEIAITAAEGTEASLRFEGVAEPDVADGRRMQWDAAGPTTYKWSVSHTSVVYKLVDGDDDPDPSWYDDPAHDDEIIVLEMPDGSVPGEPARLMECVPGPVTITVTVDGTVAEIIEEDVPCGGSDFEYVLD
jgi:hypothetical protein